MVGLPCRWWSSPLQRPPDSSSTLSPGRCVTLLLPIQLAVPNFVGEKGGECRKQVESMNEESQVTGC